MRKVSQKSTILTTSIFLLLVIIIGVVIYRYSGTKTQYAEGEIWTTTYHITYQSDRNLKDSVRVILNTIDNSISPFNKKSNITKLNDNSSTTIDNYFKILYQHSLEVNIATAGAFDPTVSPLINAWGFGFKNGNMPDSTAIDSIKKFVGIKTTSIENGKLKKKDPRTTFNFSAIAKGMACDEIAKMLRRNGVKNYLVEIGGEIALDGNNPDGKEWTISIEEPSESNTGAITTSAKIIQLSYGGLATSGNYKNFKIVDGKKVAHIINPATGYPEFSNLLSATIIAKDCMTADAYATAAMVLGVKTTQALLETHKELSGILIYADDNGKLITWSSIEK